MGQARWRWDGPVNAAIDLRAFGDVSVTEGSASRLLGSKGKRQAAFPCHGSVRQAEALEFLFGRDDRGGETAGLFEGQVNAELFSTMLGVSDS